MKKYLYIAAAALSLVGCDMKENPKAQVDKDALFASEQGLAMYCNSFYDVMPGGGMATWGNTSENVINAYQGVRTFFTSSFTASMEGKWSWGTLRNINYFIDNNTDESVSEKVRNNYTGIAKFWRAVFYFDKIRTYNDVPWIDHTLDVDDDLLMAPRDKRNTVAEKIYEDLQFAITNITEKKNASGTMVSSLVAAGMQSRFCLWEGTFRKYHGESDADKWLQRAADAAEIVMNSGSYKLYTTGAHPYRDLFVSVKPITEEVMLATEFNSSMGIVNGENRRMTAATLGNAFAPIRQYMNLFLNLDGTSYTDDEAYKTMPFNKEFDGRDKRIGQIIRVPGTTRSTGRVAPDWQVTYTGYMGLKFCNDNVNMDGQYISDQNYVFMRYAEILLNYAEAKAELKTLTDEDWAKTIGQLRARGGITSGINTKPSKVDTYLQSTFFPNVSDPVVLEVRRERMIELVWEDCPTPFADTQRWKVGDLFGIKWQGIYVENFDEDIDLDNDGKPDVHFWTVSKPAEAKPGVVYQEVSLTGENGKLWKVDTDGHTLIFTGGATPIQWNDRSYFHPVSANDIALNPNLAPQNPGY